MPGSNSNFLILILTIPYTNQAGTIFLLPKANLGVQVGLALDYFGIYNINGGASKKKNLN